MKKRARRESVLGEVNRRAAEGASGGPAPSKKATPRAKKGKKVGEHSVTDIELRKLELEVARKRREMISQGIVEQVDQSPLNLHECMKVHSLLLAHLATCAQQRASKTDQALQDLSTERDSLISAARAEAQRSVAVAEERVQAAVAERVSLELDLSGKLAEAQRVVESLDAENRSLKEGLQFANDSRDRISRSLADANAKIDSLYTYDRAVQEYKNSDAFIRELDSADAEVLEELHADYSTGVQRMSPGADMRQFLEVVRDEAGEAAKHREQRAKELDLEEISFEPPAVVSSSRDKAGPSRRLDEPSELELPGE